MKAEEAIKEFAEVWGFIQQIDEFGYEQFIKDLTALTSGCYPKDYFEWVMEGLRKRSIKFHDIKGSYRVWTPNIHTWELVTTDELYEYWKENER